MAKPAQRTKGGSVLFSVYLSRSEYLALLGRREDDNESFRTTARRLLSAALSEADGEALAQ